MRNERIICGVNPVLELLRSNPQKVTKVFISEGRTGKLLDEIYYLLRSNNIPFQKTPRQALKKYTNQSHQGVIAIVSPSTYHSEEDLLSKIAQKPTSISIILDGIEDPRNFGSILRTAECAGVDAVFIPERRSVGVTEVVAKTSAGAVEYVPIARSSNINRLIEKMKKNNIWVVGTDAKAEIEYTAWKWDAKTALVLGSEGKGLHELTRKKCDALVKIPVFGKIESLNVAVAAGVILYEIIRQRNFQKHSQNAIIR
ncbi:MAG: 23S rRNA (guanosine(2251)-2'-O)-methyltransferase RlmB [Pyrinomonadaceae bacterium]|nr:23S rRNA (guanosine(2251)-2'-O)-methyltransferase RlmB [Pyrinomonadaceae bacterium]MCX7640392.1 23S rRNA (guanosine(2251)-2'-O)-methyltransferase RlmB [Pyrinomonadaceae bacterium]MDW8304820.1 23S rRNA (guanosine(2251)-2'-O)-methyltransferase RlmB [Acidobacteriota bacterium]